MQAIHAPDLFAHQTSRRLTSSRFQRGGKPSVLVTLKVWPSCREWSHGLRCSELQARCTALQSCLRAFSSKASKGPRSCRKFPQRTKVKSPSAEPLTPGPTAPSESCLASPVHSGAKTEAGKLQVALSKCPLLTGNQPSHPM